MVISGLIDGNGYEATKHTANRFNLLTSSKRTFYEHQKKVINKVDEIVTNNCNHYAHYIKANSKLAEIFSVLITHLIILFKALVLRVTNKDKKESLWLFILNFI